MQLLGQFFKYFYKFYLKIEPSECTRSPLVLAYDAAHFSALVAMAHSKTSPKISPLIETESEPPAGNLLNFHSSRKIKNNLLVIF